MYTNFNLTKITGKPLDYKDFVSNMIQINSNKDRVQVFKLCDELQKRYNICTPDSYEQKMNYIKNISFLLEHERPSLVFEIDLDEKLKKIRILTNK